MSEIRKRIFTFLLAMAPISELRGAIPFGMKQGLPLYETLILSFIGNIIIIPPVILLFNKVLHLMRKRKATGKFANFLESRAIKKSAKVESRWFVGLLIFSAIPLPLMGAWTASMICGLLQMRLRKAVPPMVLGVIISAAIVTGISYGVVKIWGN